MRRRANLKASSRFPHKIHFRPKFTLVFLIFFFGSCCACLSDSHAATASVPSVASVASVGGRRVKILAGVDDSLTSLSQASPQGLPNLTHRSVAWHHIRSVRFGSASDAQIIRNMVVISMRHKQCLAGPLNCAESDAAAAAATSKMATTNMLTMIMMMMMIIHTTMIMLSWLASSTNLMGTDSCLSPFALPKRVCSLPQSRS